MARGGRGAARTQDKQEGQEETTRIPCEAAAHHEHCEGVHPPRARPDELT